MNLVFFALDGSFVAPSNYFPKAEWTPFAIKNMGIDLIKYPIIVGVQNGVVTNPPPYLEFIMGKTILEVREILWNAIRKFAGAFAPEEFIEFLAGEHGVKAPVVHSFPV